MKKMIVKELMISDVETIHHVESIQSAIRKMRTNKIGFLVVIGEDNSIKGVVTDRDILLSLDSDTKLMNPISEIMKPHVITINENSLINEASELMSYYQIKRLVITNDYGELTGVISLSDLARNDKCVSLATDALVEISASDIYPFYAIENDNNLLSSENTKY